MLGTQYSPIVYNIIMYMVYRYTSYNTAIIHMHVVQRTYYTFYNKTADVVQHYKQHQLYRHVYGFF
jgi:hypothetical protein